MRRPGHHRAASGASGDADVRLIPRRSPRRQQLQADRPHLWLRGAQARLDEPPREGRLLGEVRGQPRRSLLRKALEALPAPPICVGGDAHTERQEDPRAHPQEASDTLPYRAASRTALHRSRALGLPASPAALKSA